MIRYLRYIDWALLIFNIVVLMLFLQAASGVLEKELIFFARDTVIGKILNSIGYAFTYGYPVLWFVLWKIRKYYKVNFSFIWLLNTFFFVFALIFLLTDIVDFNIFYPTW